MTNAGDDRARGVDQPRFVAYRASADARVVPHDIDGQAAGAALGTIEGLTFVALYAGVMLPDEQADGSVLLAVELTPALLERIESLSAQARFLRSLIDAAHRAV